MVWREAVLLALTEHLFKYKWVGLIMSHDFNRYTVGQAGTYTTECPLTWSLWWPVFGARKVTG